VKARAAQNIRCIADLLADSAGAGALPSIPWAQRELLHQYKCVTEVGGWVGMLGAEVPAFSLDMACVYVCWGVGVGDGLW
jgi:hypothetical protein